MKKLSLLFLLIPIICLFHPFPLLAETKIISKNEINDALAGKEYMQKLTLNNSQNISSSYNLSATGAVSQMTKFYKDSDPAKAITELSIPAKSSEKIKILYSIPIKQPVGVYNGEIVISKKAENPSGGVMAKVSQPIKIIITDKKILDLTAVITPVSTEIIKGKDMVFRIAYDNRGNVAVAPEAKFSIKQGSKILFEDTRTLPKDLKSILPLEKIELPPLATPTKNYKTGNIQADISVLNNGKVLGSRSYNLKIRPHYIVIFDFIKKYWYYFIIFGILLIAESILMMYKNRLKIRKSKIQTLRPS